MLAEKQLIDWFMSNGVDIGLEIPMPLMPRLYRNALAYDPALFAFIGKSCFTASNRSNYLILNFQNWTDAFQCYMSYKTIFAVSKA